MNLEKLKQLALIDQMGAQPQVEQQKQDAQARMAVGLIQALMQQQGEAARVAEQADYRAGLLRQGQEGIDVRRDTLKQQKAMNKTAAADKRAAAQTASADRQLAVITQLAEKGDPTAIRALAGMNPAYGKARTDLTNEATATRRTGVNAMLQGLYTQNATDPTLLKKALSGIFANPTATGVPGTTVEDLNAAPWDAMGAGMPTPGPGFFSQPLVDNPPPVSFPQGGQMERRTPKEFPTQYGPPARGIFDQVFGAPMPAQGIISPEDAAKLLIQQMFSDR